MAFPNVTDIVTSAIESRTRKIRDNVTKNNALLARLQKKGKVRSITGGPLIYEELSYSENGNAGWYSGYDLLPVAAQDVISAAQFSLKQFAVPVVISGLEKLENSGKEKMIDLISARLEVAEATMKNQMSTAIYGDGTGSGGKTLVGLAAAVPDANTIGTYGNIDRSVWTFWQPQRVAIGAAMSTSNLPTNMNTLWAKQVRGSDRPDLIIFPNDVWGIYVATLQAQQRFTDPKSADLGFPSLKFMDADVVLDGGVGGAMTSTIGYFLNTDYFHFRPHKERDMVPLDPNRRVAVNQDAEVQILAWAGALTCSNQQLQGRLKCS